MYHTDFTHYVKHVPMQTAWQMNVSNNAQQLQLSVNTAEILGNNISHYEHQVYYILIQAGSKMQARSQGSVIHLY